MVILHGNLISLDAPCYDPVLFEQLTGDLIRWATLHTHHAAGPSSVGACVSQNCVPLSFQPL